MKNNWVKGVAGFMKAGDQTVGTENYDQFCLYDNLIHEEHQEFECSTNAVESLDAIVDKIWVEIAYALSRGWDIEGAFNELIRSNMSKVDGASGKLLKREDGKILKPATYSPPNFEPYLTVKDTDENYWEF